MKSATVLNTEISVTSVDEVSKLLNSEKLMEEYIFRSLLMKKGLIEKDEFDKKERNVMNYGHSFGHAIEAASNFKIPHGIGVTIGMDIANFISMKLGRLKQKDYTRMHPTLKRNWSGFENTPIPMNKFFSAIANDKKNEGNKLVLILPDSMAIPKKISIPKDEQFSKLCKEWFKSLKEGK